MRLLFVFSLLFIFLCGSSSPPGPVIVKFDQSLNKILVNGLEFHVLGVAYSPVPRGDSPANTPKGDYFTVDYAYLWNRDFPLIKSMGANTIRIYSWNNDQDHTDFLNAVYHHGLKVIITYYLGSEDDTPVDSLELQQSAIDKFLIQVKSYKDHPAILAWMFGNELNGDWNKYLDQFNANYNCGWKSSDCMNSASSTCKERSSCVYQPFYRWLNEAARQAKQYTSRLMMTGFADVDLLVGSDPNNDKLALYGPLLTDHDVIGVQLYRGKSFGNFFQQFQTELPGKGLLVTEFGVDAYNDPCGWSENSNWKPCRNIPLDGMGGVNALNTETAYIGCSSGESCKITGEQAQSDYDQALIAELNANHAAGGAVVGGLLMSWVDELWKGSGTQDQCDFIQCPFNQLSTCIAGMLNSDPNDPNKQYLPGNSGGCGVHAHISCQNWDARVQDLCGYFLEGSPDRYVNEQWFGITNSAPCSDLNSGVPEGKPYRYDSLTPRLVYQTISKLWTGKPVDPVIWGRAQCDSISECWKCLKAYGDVGFEYITGTNSFCTSQCSLPDYHIYDTDFQGFASLTIQSSLILVFSVAALLTFYHMADGI